MSVRQRELRNQQIPIMWRRLQLQRVPPPMVAGLVRAGAAAHCCAVD